jgi:hypothetical protein
MSSGAGTSWAYGQPVSDLDRATIIHHRDGRREIVYAPPIEEERERQRQHREWAAEVERQRVAQLDHDRRVAERVRAFLTSSEPEPAPNARAALIRHLDRLDRARRLAAAATVRGAEVKHAQARRDAAQTALDQLEAEVRAEFFAWLQYGSTGLPPPGRGDERDGLRATISASQPLADLAEPAAFEVAVADGVVTALTDMTAGLHADLLFETAQPIVDRVRTLAAEMSRAYAILNALSAATNRRGGFTSHQMLSLPSLPGGAKVTLDVEPAAADTTTWRQALADIEANANAAITLPPGAPPPKPPPRVGLFFRRS